MPRHIVCQFYAIRVKKIINICMYKCDAKVKDDKIFP